MNTISPTLTPRPRTSTAILLLVAGAAVLWLLSTPAFSTALQYDRADGLWSALTSHFTHWSNQHLLYSGGAFLILTAITCRLQPRLAMICITLSCLTVGAAVHWLTDLHFYRGLSGIDSALFMLCCMQLLQSSRSKGRWFLIVLIAAFLAKIVFEWRTGLAVFADTRAADAAPVPLAHLVGALTGFITFALQFTAPSPSNSASSPPGTHHPGRAGTSG